MKLGEKVNKLLLGSTCQSIFPGAEVKTAGLSAERD